MSTTEIPNAVPRGVIVREVGLGAIKALLLYENGDWRFQHLCDRGPRGTIICAPLLSLDHSVGVDDMTNAVTVAPSIVCPDCNTHGWVVRSEWRQA